MNDNGLWSKQQTQLEAENAHLKSLLDQHIKSQHMAEEALKHNAEFIAMISHEIRTSMNAILSLTELLQHTAINDEQQYYLELMDTSNATLLSLVNNVLDLSKMEAGKMQLKNDPFDLINTVEDLLYSLAPPAFQKKVEMILEVESEIPLFVMGDTLKVRQIVMNLVQNAIKFTHEGEILVSLLLLDASPELTSVKIVVHDTGIGMTEQQLDYLFQHYSQVHEQDHYEYEGTGLGLMITKQLIELMHGHIEVKSEAGVGTEISVILHFEKYTEVPAIPFKKDVLSLMNVVVLDQNKTSCELISNLLSEWGAKVTHRFEMNAGFFTELHSGVYDLILIDLNTINQQFWDQEKENLKKQKLCLLAPLGNKIEGEFNELFKSVVTKPVRKLHLLNSVLAIEIEEN